MFRYKELSTLRKLIVFKKLIASGIKVVSGAIASFVTKKATKAQSVSVTLEPIQDLHGYDKPWSGGNGKNLLNIPDIAETTKSGVTYSVKDGVLKINGTCTAGFTPVSVSLSLPSATYTMSVNLVSGSTGGANDSFNCYSSDETRQLVAFGTVSYPVTRTFSSDVSTCNVTINKNATFSNAVLTFQVEKGSSATSWEPFSNICPISGRTEVVTQRTGKNLLELPFVHQSTVAVSKDNCFFIKAGDYVLSFASIGNATTWRLCLYMFDEDGNALLSNEYAPNRSMQSTGAYWRWGGNVSDKASPIHIDSDCYVRFTFSLGTTSASDVATDAQLETGTTATDYEPYNGTRYTTDLGRTVYGGTLDVVSGELVVDRAMVDLGTLNWANNQTGTNAFEAYSTANYVKSYTTNLLSDVLVQKSSFVDVAEYTVRMGNDFLAVKVPKAIASSGTQVKQWLSDNNVTLCYELATPQTYQLAPQEVELLLGQNNVWSDSGEIQVTYKR